MKQLTMTKRIMIYILISITIIQIFTLAITVANLWLAYTVGAAIDYTPLNSLITSIVGEVGAFLVYCVKSGLENREGGLVFEAAMRDLDESIQEESAHIRYTIETNKGE